MPRPPTPWTALVVALLASALARAEVGPEAGPEGSPDELPAEPPRTGWGVQGLPLVNYNSDEGLEIGRAHV